MMNILVADDHAMIRKRIKQIIAEESDMQVCSEAQGGNEALEILKKKKTDLVILDMNMPDLNGLDTLKKIRALYPALPVGMLTAPSEVMYSAKALKAVANGFISKETAGEELVKTI